MIPDQLIKKCHVSIKSYEPNPLHSKDGLCRNASYQERAKVLAKPDFIKHLPRFSWQEVVILPF